ncbi:MAG: MFS transporter [Solidesulfovibrio sp. DCME]|uniref:MFS transporter n=1 Tax=Solidesulfovibrio sp. DCME TaxID=3447380 RepID=UPI003D09EFCE
MSAFFISRRLPDFSWNQWLICAIAATGFAFDTYELLMLPLIVKPALLELGGIQPGSPSYSLWFGLLFYIPALAGGAFGLLGGYLTDCYGRKKVLTISILLYAFAAFVAGFSISLPMLLVLRCLVFIGVSVEFVAAVAWLAELFPEQQREGILGITQVFSSLGGVMVAVANGIVTAWSTNSPAPLLLGFHLPALQLPAIATPPVLDLFGSIANPHAHWRYTLMSGLLPAIPLLLVRPFLPESPLWMEKRKTGQLQRPNITELFSQSLRKTTLVVTLMFMLSYAAFYGAIAQATQIIPGLPEVQADVAAALRQRLPDSLRDKFVAQWRGAGKTGAETAQLLRAEERRIASAVEQAHAAQIMKAPEFGGLLGRFALAALAVIVVSRRRLLRMFLLPGLVVMPLTFAWAGVTSISWLEYGIFLAGFLTVGQFSFWGNYLPQAFPLHLRGTGESFAANIGGRMIGTSFAALTQWIAYWLPGSAANPTRIAYAAAAIAFSCYLLNIVASFWLPEPGVRDLSK